MNALLDALLNPSDATADPLATLRDEFNATLAAVLDRNDYLRSFECPHCTYRDDDGVIYTPCQLAFREWKSPEWIATRTAEEGKHDCPINLACWKAANRLLVARDFGHESDATWQEAWQSCAREETGGEA